MSSLSTQFSFQVFVALASTQLKQQVEFYRDFLAIAPHPHTPAYAEFHLPGLRLAIFVPNASNVAEFAQSAGSPVSLCMEVEDLEVAIARLKAMGHLPPGERMQTSHGQEIYAYDPDGNRIILHQS